MKRGFLILLGCGKPKSLQVIYNYVTGYGMDIVIRQVSFYGGLRTSITVLSAKIPYCREILILSL